MGRGRRSQRGRISAPLIRFGDGMIVAVERGTSLDDVLRAQAQDARDTTKGFSNAPAARSR